MAFAKWPTNAHIDLDKKLKLLKSLMKYSKNMEKIDNFAKNQDIKYLEDLPESTLLITELNENKSIFSTLLSNYKSFLKGQLLIDLNKNQITEYCNTNNIILFFNKFNDYNDSIENYWFIKAQKLSQKFPLDFCISIPEFTVLDIISLLANPMTKEQGSIFNGVCIDEQLMENFTDLIELSTDQIAIEIDAIVKKFIHKNYTDILGKYLKPEFTIDEILLQILNTTNSSILTQYHDILENLQLLLTSIRNVINIINAINSNTYTIPINFSDIENLDFNNFDLYINSYQTNGFYICQYPETKDYFIKMQELLQSFTPQDKKFPLLLFEFRIFIRFYKIQFEPPKNVNLYDFPDLIMKTVEYNLNNNDFKLSHLVGLLLSNVPKFVHISFENFKTYQQTTLYMCIQDAVVR